MGILLLFHVIFQPCTAKCSRGMSTRFSLSLNTVDLLSSAGHQRIKLPCEQFCVILTKNPSQ